MVRPINTGKRHQQRTRARRARPNAQVADAPQSNSLLHGVDNGAPIHVDPTPYWGRHKPREPGWGPFLDGFLAQNRQAFNALQLEARVVSGRSGARLELTPGIMAGAIPLRSAVTGQVTGGVIVGPRFGWAGVGRVLSATGWGSAPEFLALPLVPGSGREVPPWVLAGPVLHRIADMLKDLRPGYRTRCEIRNHPRGQIQWASYARNQLSRGTWHRLPCRFSELDSDDSLRQAIRWALERINGTLVGLGPSDPVALGLIAQIVQLLKAVADVPARKPSHSELDLNVGGVATATAALREGLRAMSWIVDERGLGGGRTSDGLSWALSLDQLWERYVEHLVREQAMRTRGQLRVGRLGETTVPLPWNRPSMRALGHLIPDFVIDRDDSVEIIDAKYKSHFADLEGLHWSAQDERIRESMRSDIHQVLAYAATVDSRRSVTATLFYPVQSQLFAILEATGQVESRAMVSAGTRNVTLCLRAAPFGRVG